jgi:hypothetical protein
MLVDVIAAVAKGMRPTVLAATARETRYLMHLYAHLGGDPREVVFTSRIDQCRGAFPVFIDHHAHETRASDLIACLGDHRTTPTEDGLYAHTFTLTNT